MGKNSIYKLGYQSGFGNEFSTEAEKGALPIGQNSPQKPPLGLYPEQLNGSAFTAPRNENKRSWLYRTLPSVKHPPFKPIKLKHFISPPFHTIPTPNQMRWTPQNFPDHEINFLESLITFAGNGSPQSKNGIAVHLYACNQDMEDCFFYNSDGEFLIVPQEGGLKIHTELGIIEIEPNEIAVIPRGVRFKVDLMAKRARGYVCENFGTPFTLPNLGPIGANGLANPRDFLTPVAAYDKKFKPSELITKFQGRLWKTELDHSPLNVVAWHGNYVPYKYDLSLFNTINSVSYDHPDPSIFTVLTSPTPVPGTANCDFVIFPPRWVVSEKTFRPPYFHRNTMSEFMGLIHGSYDAKPVCAGSKKGFLPGGASLHNCMSGHGPDAEAFLSATNSILKPDRYKDTLAFMFETSLCFDLSEFALESPHLQKDYFQCWQGLEPSLL